MKRPLRIAALAAFILLSTMCKTRNQQAKEPNAEEAKMEIIAETPEEEDTTSVVMDTLRISGHDEFLSYPFGLYHDYDSLKTALSYFEESGKFDFGSRKDKNYIRTYYLFYDEANVVAIRNEGDGDGAQFPNSYFVRFAIIQSADVILDNGIRIGLSKAEVLRLLGEENADIDDNVDVIVCESYFSGLGYFYFTDGHLSSILIDLEDGTDCFLFINKIKKCPQCIKDAAQYGMDIRDTPFDLLEYLSKCDET